MTRCDYDAVFYRVFCITLLAIAFTFTIVLTNVFIDIDGLLARKRGNHKAPIIPNNNDSPEELTPEPISNDDTNYGDNFDSYRTKRSIETQNFLFHIKNPKIKNILTNRLSHLLEALDEGDGHGKNSPNTQKETQKDSMLTVLEDDEEKVKKKRDEDILHLTMHNILLQGIIGHMNMNDVYKRVNTLMHNFNKEDDKSAVNQKTDPLPIGKIKPGVAKTEKPPETKGFLTDFIKCHERRDHKDEQTNHAANPVSRTAPEIIKHEHHHSHVADHNEKENNSNYRIGSDVLINTLIDIKPIVRSKNDTTPKDNVHGIIELIYNGKSYKFTRIDAETNQNTIKNPSYNIIAPKSSTTDHPPDTTAADISKKGYSDLKKIPKDYLNKFVSEYFKHFPSVIQEPNMHPKELNQTKKRSKRHIKVKTDKKYFPSSRKKKQNSDDDDLYVEIETHISKKDLKAEKKNKLIKNLIEKIQKAINSNDTKMIDNAIKNTKKRTKIWRVRKRQQNPLVNDTKIITNKVNTPMATVIQRQLNPITIHKTIPKQESSISVHDKTGDSWKKEYIGPAFLAATKAINSAEMSELDVDYKNVLNTNGVPQRLQKPLNTDMSPETMNPNPNPYYDLDLDHVFQVYDQPADPNPEANWETDDWKNPNFNLKHAISRRSIKNKHHYHSNEYKRVFNGNVLPYHHYKDILRSKLSIPQVNMPKYSFFNNDSHLTLDDNILEKNLKPGEIFGLANMFNRKKRTLSVKRISNIKSKRKINRYLNTKQMSNRNQQFQKRRNKRQINKIRIIASDYPHKQQSDENVYVVADDDNVFADRAIVKEEKSDIEHEQEESEMMPYHSDFQDDATFRLFDGKSRHNALMSKYPHVFMEEITRSREEIEPEGTFLLRKVPVFSKYDDVPTIEFENIDIKNPSDQDINLHADLDILHTTERLDKEQNNRVIINDLQDPKAKYKVTLKILPKNTTGSLHGDFKEVYTSINKRFNKNGLQYLSLVNVSEISEIKNINKTKDQKDDTGKADNPYLSDEQEDKMQILLREHQKNIDEQLNRLNEEKFKIESILTDDNNTVIPHCEYLDGIMQLKTQQLANTDENTETVSLPPLTTKTTTHIPSTTEAVTKTLSTTILTTTSQFSTPPSTTMSSHPNTLLNDNLKKKILHTIERNENLTDQILKKIDKNSEILQMFLRRLTDKMETKLSEYKPSHKEEEKNDIPMANKIEPSNSFTNDWRPHTPLKFNEFNPNYYLRRNDSHVSIPFVYAYPPAILNPAHKLTSAVGNVYHGHIHQALHARDNTPVKEAIITLPKAVEANNQTRFFLDDMESDYKVIPMSNMKMYQLHKNTTVML